MTVPPWEDVYNCPSQMVDDFMRLFEAADDPRTIELAEKFARDLLILVRE